MLLRCGIYVSQESLHSNLQAEVNDTVINKCWPLRRALVVVIIFLYALTTITFATNWSSIRFAFVENGQNFWTVFYNLNGTDAAFWGTSITASMSTILADLYMVCAIPLGIIHISSPSFLL